MKANKIIEKWFKSYFKKYPEMESFYFLIYELDDGVYLANEECGINGIGWCDLSDEELFESSYMIQNAVEQLDKSKVTGLDKIKKQLGEIVCKLQKEADDSNPLNLVVNDVWSDENRENLTKLVKKSLEKEIPWKYVSYCVCEVRRSGEVIIEEYQR